MASIQLTISDLSTVAGYTRFQMRGLLDDVFPQPARIKKGRSQRTFSPQELLLVAVACELEKKYGVRRNVVALVADALRQTLNGPRSANRSARLAITFVPPTATYLPDDQAVKEGLILALGDVFASVDEYLGVTSSNRDRGQVALPLGPVVVTNRRVTGARNR
jgi:hypothetical protein